MTSAASRAYYRAYIGNLRAQAIKLLGGSCRRCGTKGTPENWLELHHVIHAPDSATNGYWRIKEALTHPERFLLLCRTHHLDTHVREMKRSGNADPESGMDVKAMLSLRAGSNRDRATYEARLLRKHFPAG